MMRQNLLAFILGAVLCVAMALFSDFTSTFQVSTENLSPEAISILNENSRTPEQSRRLQQLLDKDSFWPYGPDVLLSSIWAKRYLFILVPIISYGILRLVWGRRINVNVLVASVPGAIIVLAAFFLKNPHLHPWAPV